MALKPIGGEIEAQVLNDNFSYLDERIGLYTETFEVLIPYDYPDLQAAVDHLSRFKASQGVRIVLKIASGHALTKGLMVENGDYAYFRIESESGTVQLDDNFVGVGDEQHLIVGRYAIMPVLACLIDMGGRFGNGYYGYASSSGRVEEECGVINAGRSGLSFVGGQCWAYRTVWDGARREGIRAQQAAIIAAQSSNANNCGYADEFVDGSVFASRGSTIHFQHGNATNGGHVGLRIQRSTANVQDADFSDAASDGIEAQLGSRVEATGVRVNNCGGRGVTLRHGSQINLYNANIANNAALDLFITSGGNIVNLTGATTTNGNPSTDDTNLNNFNTTTSQGIIFAASQ